MELEQAAVPAPAATAVSAAFTNLLWIVVAAGSLGIVVILNGYPLVFPDSGTYVRQALKLEGVIDRPPFYSLFLVLLNWRLSLWPIPFVQDLIACYVITRSLSIAFPDLTPARRAVAILLTAAFSSLPWFSNQIMPDIYTPLILLVIFCLCHGWRQLARVEQIVWPLALLAMLAFHQVNPAFALLLLSGVSLQLVKWRPSGDPHAVRRSILLVLVPALLAILAQSLYGYAVIGRFSPSPSAPVFSLARLLGDGPAQRYLADVCPRAAFTLCRYQDGLREGSDSFLWGASSPLHELVRERGEVGALKEAGDIVAGTLRAYPGSVVVNALRNTARQLVHVATADPECPCSGATKIDRVIRELFPGEHAAFVNSLQNRGALPLQGFAWADQVVLVASAAFLGLLAVVRRQALAGNAGRLLGLIAWGCLVNAALMGALSVVTDRYQARLVWLVPMFAIALLLSRRRFAIGRSNVFNVLPAGASGLVPTQAERGGRFQ